VDWLTESNLKILQEYMTQGGTVVCDSATEVQVPGAVRLDFPLGVSDRRNGYGDLAQIALVKAAIEEHVTPWAQSDDPHLLLRRVRSGDVDYLWVVSLMDHQQDIGHDRFINKEADLAALEAQAGFDERDYEGTVSVPAGDYAVYDVLHGRRIDCRTEGDRLVIPVQMGLWQGMLLGLYPAPVRALKVTAPESAQTVETAAIEVQAQTEGGGPAPNLPLEIKVTDPIRNVSRDYSHRALAPSGHYRFEIFFAGNDMRGAWDIDVRDASTGASGHARIRLRKRTTPLM